jgi:uncharacterized small protein (DUF1192 family)
MALALDFEIDFNGACVTVAGESLSAGCLSDEEVDRQIDLLKADLDRLAAEMKAAIREHAGRRPDPGP